MLSNDPAYILLLFLLLLLRYKCCFGSWVVRDLHSFLFFDAYPIFSNLVKASTKPCAV